VTVGSWASALLPRVRTPLEVTRQALFWVWPEDIDAFELEEFTCWAAQIDGYEGLFYGFPMLPASMGGQLGLRSRTTRREGAEPGNVAPIDAAEFAPIRAALKSIFVSDPARSWQRKRACTRRRRWPFHRRSYPESDRVTIACGFSGHGFKFASVIGEALADLAMEGRTALPIGFLGLDRFQNQRPT
jgi:glycine/D-amino acid oxidase-like deaminating enzyme